MSTAPPMSSRPGRLTYSCTRCANRKVKCDRQRPCSACAKYNVECIYNSSDSHRKKHKRVKVQTLTERLSHYESLLQEHGIDTRKPPTSQAIPESLQAQPNPINESQLQSRSRSEIQHRYMNTSRKTSGEVHFKFVEK